MGSLSPLLFLFIIHFFSLSLLYFFSTYFFSPSVFFSTTPYFLYPRHIFFYFHTYFFSPPKYFSLSFTSFSNTSLCFSTTSKFFSPPIFFPSLSQAEIKNILDLGVPPDRIIYANPCKQASHLKYACKRGVATMTFDNEVELHKVCCFCRLSLSLSLGQ